MPDFSNYSHYDSNAAFTNVRYGANSLLLEVEFNELQNILDNKISTLIYDRFGNGFYKTGSTSVYAGGTLTFSNDKAFVNGDIVVISSLSLSLSEGDTAYLDVWEQEVTGSTTLKKYGNQQESTTVTNYIKDSRVTEETTRRTQLQYNLVKTTGVSGHTYLPVCTITGGSLVDNRVAVGATTAEGTSVLAYYENSVTSGAGVSAVSIGISSYNPTTDLLLAHCNSVFLKKDADYTVTGTGVTSAINKVTGTWASSTFDFLVIKNVTVSLSSAIQTQIDGYQIQLNSVKLRSYMKV